MSPIINVIIPARAGSKGIKNKNLLSVLGEPLYQRSINHALELKDHFEIKIWLSTDIKEIIEKKDQYKEINICQRRKELAGDEILTIDVVKHLIKDKKMSGQDIMLLFQPTSPYRNKKEIINAINTLLNESKWKSAVSLSLVKSNHPFRMKRLNSDNECIDFIDQGFEDMRPRQKLTKVYIRSGNFYMAYIDAILNENTLLPKPTKGIVHTEMINSINIDNINDLYMAEIIGKRKSLN
tara:strand:- start:2137 stop:2850 length:714 start_codon:yes stop_codon:yes gene_type:complete